MQNEINYLHFYILPGRKMATQSDFLELLQTNDDFVQWWHDKLAMTNPYGDELMVFFRPFHTGGGDTIFRCALGKNSNIKKTLQPHTFMNSNNRPYWNSQSQEPIIRVLATSQRNRNISQTMEAYTENPMRPLMLIPNPLTHPHGKVSGLHDDSYRTIGTFLTSSTVELSQQLKLWKDLAHVLAHKIQTHPSKKWYVFTHGSDVGWLHLRVEPQAMTNQSIRSIYNTLENWP